MRLVFGNYAPDLPPLVNQSGLNQARNMLPKAGGYGQVRGLSAISGATVLSERPRGAISGIDPSGTGYLYAGSGTKLWVQRDAGMTDISKSGGYAMSPTERWSFAKFGNRIYAANMNNTIQHHVLGSPLTFLDVPRLAPRARHIATIGNFLFAGHIYDPVDGPMPDAVSWSGIDNALLWPAVASDDAAQVQADRQPLEGNGGQVQDVVSAGEIGIVFQERAIHRFDYVGGAGIFEKNRMEQGNGMLIPYSAVPFERMVFYIAEDGFRLFDYTASTSIGKDRLSSTFFADLDTAYLDRVETAKDPDRTVIWVIYAGAGNTGGRPNKAIWYDYQLNRFSHGALELEGLIQNATTTPPSIDAPASAGDPDDVDDASGEFSFDDRPTDTGNSRMGAFDSTFLASDFTGGLLEGLIETGDIEGAPGKFFWLDRIRPLVDDRKVEISVAEMERRVDAKDLVWGPYIPMDEDGTIPIRSDARYHRLRIKMPPGWNDAVGLDLLGEVSGDR